MARYVRLPSSSSGGGSAPDGGVDWSSILGSVAGGGGKLARIVGGLSGSPTLGAIGTGATGLSGLVSGIKGGHIDQSIGGALNLGSSIAGLADLPTISTGLSALGGPLALGSGIAHGDPLSATLGGIQTASTVSGLLGGPTVSGLAADALVALAPELAATLGITGGAAGGGAAGGAAAGAAAGAGASAAAMAALAPFALMAAGGLYSGLSGGGDMFNGIFGGGEDLQAFKQAREYEHYADAFPLLAQRRVAGANLFPTLGEYDTPEEIASALTTAASGAHANTEPAAWNLSHKPSKLGLDPVNLDAWFRESQGLSAKNSAAFLTLMDRAKAAGLDPGNYVGDWNLSLSPNKTIEEYTTRLYDDPEKHAVSGFYREQPQTQEAQDLGNTVSTIGRDLGVNFDYRYDDKGDELDYQNFNPDQLPGYGFEPGKYGVASLNYIRSMDPNAVNSPKWAEYAAALDPAGELASLAPLTITPRKRVLPDVMPHLASIPVPDGGGF